MSTDLQTDLESLQLNNYVSLVIVTGVVYDYVLTFSSEIEYIWKKPWTWVSTTFLLVRYGGFLTAMLSSLAGTTFVPGPLSNFLEINILKLCFHWQGKAFLYLSSWGNTIFINAADLVMIFRVYALYRQSRKVLYPLLLMYIAEVVVTLFSCIMYTRPGAVLVFLPPAPDPSVCIVQYPSWTLARYSIVPVVVLQAVMCILGIFQSLRQLLQLHKETGRWQLNQYIRLLAQQGVLYFFVNLFHAVFIQGLFSITFGQTLSLILTAASNITLFTMNPRFILHLRELHAQNVYNQGIDSGFGMLSGHGASMFTGIGSTLHFADPGLGRGLDEAEEIPMEAQRRVK